MTKRKKKTVDEQLEDLTELAGKLGLPDGAFDGDLEDACDDEARMMFEDIKDSVLLDQLKFLYMHGFHVGRLRELIEEMAKEHKKNQP